MPSRSLDQSLYRLLLWRLFLPLLLLTMLGFASAIYLGKRNLEEQQQQLTASMAQMIEDYLDQAGRVLDAVSRVAETSDVDDVGVSKYMQATWEAYGYFEALYRLDEKGTVTLLAPMGLQYQRYLGLDMSQQPYFEQVQRQRDIVISSPFNSLSTGHPTVYMARALEDGGVVVGALSLHALQTTIMEASDNLPDYGEVFIVDRSGTLLAHTHRPDRVAQQENVSHLRIVQRSLSGRVTLIYRVGGQVLLGSGMPIAQVGWVVIEHLPFFVMYGPYVGMISFLFLLAIGIWGFLAWTLRDWLQHHVVMPLSHLGRVTEAVASGDFAQEDALTTIPAAFIELNVLRRDFKRMSQAIQARQTALQRSEERYRILYSVSHLLVGIPSLDEVSQAALLAVPHLGAQRGALILLDVQGEPRLYSTETERESETFQRLRAFIKQMQASKFPEHGLGQYQLRGANQPVLIGDVKEEPQMFSSPYRNLSRALLALLDPESQDNVRSVMVLPVLGQYEETIGFMIYGHRQPDIFGEEDVDLAEEIALRVSLALQNARLYERARQEIDERKQAEVRIQRLLDHQMAVNRLALAVSEYRDLHRIYYTIYEHVKALMDAQTFIVSFYDEETQRIRAEYGVDNDVVLDVTDLRPIPFKETAYGTQSRVIRTGEAFCAPDLSKILMKRNRLEGPSQEGQARFYASSSLGQQVNKSAAFVPLKLEGDAGGATVGVIQVQSQRLDAYTQEDVDLLSAMANVAALAIQNARLFVDVQTSAQRLQALYETSRALSSSLDEESLMRVILERVYRALDCEHVIISTVDQEAKIIGFKHGIWFGEFDVFPDWIQMSRYPLDHNDILADVYRTGRPEIIEGWDERFNREIWDEFAHERLQRVFMPMKIGDRVTGVVEVGYNKGEGGHIDSDTVQMLVAFMDQAAVALENARLFQSEKTQRELAEALGEAATIVNSTLDLDYVLDRILEQIERVVVGEAFNVMLIEDHLAQTVRSRGYHQLQMDQQAQELTLRVEDYANLRAIRDGETYLVSDTHNDPDWALLPGWEKIHSYLGVPIQIKGETVGILSVEGMEVAQFDTHDAQRLEAFASHAATAIENAQLFQRLRRYAEGLEELVQERTMELQAQYAWLDAVLHSVSDGIIVVDTVGEILQMNSVAETWLNQTLTLEDAKTLRETVKALATRAFERPEKTLTLTGLDLHLDAAPISEPGMEQVAVVAMHNISHLKALDRMKSQFVSNVSHELRTPVTTIKLYANLLQHCAPEKRPGYIAALSKEADRQAALIEDILQISRIDAGRLELKPKLTSLSQLVEGVVSHHKVLAESRGLNLESRITNALPKVMIDPDRIVQVLNNLVENAIRYTPEGGRIVVSIDRMVKEARTWALVRVVDTGIGIPEEELPHIFNRFFRGVEPRRMQLPGTGLGLTIVKEIVELHGGRVAVVSQVGEGSTFTVWLPFAMLSED